MNQRSKNIDWPDALELGPVTVLTGLDKGKYPHGNSILVHGSHETILIDPSLTVAQRGAPTQVDQILSLIHI